MFEFQLSHEDALLSSAAIGCKSDIENLDLRHHPKDYQMWQGLRWPDAIADSRLLLIDVSTAIC